MIEYILLGLILQCGSATVPVAAPKFRRGEIIQLAYADRMAVVLDVEWRGGWEYTVVPAELVFPRGTPKKGLTPEPLTRYW